MNIMAEKIQGGLMSPDAERYFGVLLERIDGKFDTLIESFSSLDERISRLEIRMDRLEMRLDTIDGDILVFQQTLEQTTIETKRELRAMRQELKSVVRDKEFFALEKRVSKIEQALTA